MDHPLQFEPATVKSIIRLSNFWATKNPNRYPIKMNDSIKRLYDFLPCQCSDDCDCRRFSCNGHWVLKKDIPFTVFRDSFLNSFVNQKQHAAVLEERNLNARGIKNAIAALDAFSQRWETVSKIRHHKCLVCSDWCHPKWEQEIRPTVLGLHLAKAWSLLSIDVLMPYDSRSKSLLNRLHQQEYLELHRELRQRVIEYLTNNQLSLSDFRKHDKPQEFFEELEHIAPYRPISRVLDKIFYAP